MAIRALQPGAGVADGEPAVALLMRGDSTAVLIRLGSASRKGVPICLPVWEYSKVVLIRLTLT